MVQTRIKGVLGKTIASLMIVAISACSDKKLDEAEELVRNTLNDPFSAEFRDVRTCYDDKDIVMGEVNGKNLYGAYTGFKPFYLSGYTVAFAGDDEFVNFMGRCFGSDDTDSSLESSPRAEEPASEDISSVAQGAVAAADSSGDATIALDNDVRTESSPVEECWMDYCPCDTSDPDYGYMDPVLCRDVESGRGMDAEVARLAAQARDARRALREFESEY